MPLNDDPDALSDEQYWAKAAALKGGPCHAIWDDAIAEAESRLDAKDADNE